MLDIMSNDAQIAVRRREMPTANLATQAAVETLEPQTFAAESDRARLSGTAVKAFIALGKAWELSNAQASALLGVSASTLDRMKRGYRPTLSQDQLTRVSALVGIYKGLHLLFVDETADEWARRTNSGPLFDRETPIKAMIEGGIPRILHLQFNGDDDSEPGDRQPADRADVDFRGDPVRDRPDDERAVLGDAQPVRRQQVFVRH
jgi:hypothetical protein